MDANAQGLLAAGAFTFTLGCWSFLDVSAFFHLLAPFVAFFVLAFFGGLGGWAALPVPLIFPGFWHICWNLAFVDLPACCLMPRIQQAALPEYPPRCPF